MVDRVGSRIVERASDVFVKMAAIDEGDLSEAMRREFPAARLALASELQRAQDYDAELYGTEEAVKAQIATLKNWLERVGSRRAALHAAVEAAIQESPGVPFTLPSGEPVRLQKNGGMPALRLELDETLGTKSVKDILAYDTKVPERYRKLDVYTVLDRHAIRQDLIDGVDIAWASLEQGEHLRGFKVKPAKEQKLKEISE